jgi:hypothetical protein
VVWGVAGLRGGNWCRGGGPGAEMRSSARRDLELILGVRSCKWEAQQGMFSLGLGSKAWLSSCCPLPSRASRQRFPEAYSSAQLTHAPRGMLAPLPASRPPGVLCWLAGVGAAAAVAWRATGGQRVAWNLRR